MERLMLQRSTWKCQRTTRQIAIIILVYVAMLVRGKARTSTMTRHLAVNPYDTLIGEGKTPKTHFA